MFNSCNNYVVYLCGTKIDTLSSLLMCDYFEQLDIHEENSKNIFLNKSQNLKFHLLLTPARTLIFASKYSQ